MVASRECVPPSATTRGWTLDVWRPRRGEADGGTRVMLSHSPRLTRAPLGYPAERATLGGGGKYYPPGYLRNEAP